MRKGVLLVVYTNVRKDYFRIIVYTISRIVPDSIVMMRLAILAICMLDFLPEVCHF